MLKKTLYSVAIGLLVMSCGLAYATPLVVDFDTAMLTANLNPNSTDGNGDASGAANGILDSDELAVLAWVLADTGRPHHDAVHAAYTTNLTRMNLDMAGNPNLAGLAAGYAVPLAAYITLGDAGGFARGQAILYTYSAHVLLTNPANYDQTQASFLSAAGDADGDGLTNLQEYTAITGTGGVVNPPTDLTPSAKRIQYLHDVFTVAPVVVDFDAALTNAGLNPASADSNGPGGTPNGILDSDELAVLSHVLADNTNTFFPAARAAYLKNLAQMTTDAGPYAPLVATALAGYMTLGDTNTVGVVGLLLASKGLTLTVAGYDTSQSVVYSLTADPDQDLRENLTEYGQVTGPGGPGSQKRVDYITAVFTPYVNAACESCSSTTGTVAVGSNVCLGVPTSTGHTFQWSFNDAPLLDGRTIGSTCQWLHISNVQLADAGVYKCTYNDGAKAVQTYTTKLQVAAALPVGGTLVLTLVTGLLASAAALVLVRTKRRA